MSFFKHTKRKILFVSAEEAPFAKVGGLGEVMFSLPRALVKLGHDARVMIPRYGTIDHTLPPVRMAYEGLEVPTSPNGEGKKLVCNVRVAEQTRDANSPVTTYFLENQEYYELRSNIYGYGDDKIRFALLSRGCLEFLRVAKEWRPDVIVASDWMTGFVPNFMKTDYADDPVLKNIAVVFSLHSLGAQGTSRHHKFIPESERDDGYGPIPDFFGERMRDINSMRRGILYADVVNTVSERYAEEILTEEFGEGLEGILRERRQVLFGILNGIDYEKNDPAHDPLLEKHFTAHTLEKRDENKTALQKRMGLPQKQDAFLMGIVSRLTRQKGFVLLQPIIESFLRATGAQLIVVGTGDTELMTFFQDLGAKLPEQVRVLLEFDEALPHLVFAGSDVILVPSLFEPSGLTQMEAMHYGAVPVARRTGGFADTIEDYAPETGKGTGFLFNEFDATVFLIALVRAFTNWQHKGVWRKLQARVMEHDFSWLHSAKKYEAFFEKVIRDKGSA